MRVCCIKCGKSADGAFRTFCECGGIFDVEYDLSRAALHTSDNPYVRFADLLPVEASRDRMPKDAVYTPAVHAKTLGKYLGIESLYLKNDTVLPTNSTKDRMAAVSTAYLWDCGVRNFCASSTGNSSTAYAHSMPAFPDMRLYLFTAENFVHRVQHADTDQIEHFGLRDASFVDAAQCSTTYAQENGLVAETGFFNLGRREGLKLAYLEACEQIPKPIDWYVQAVSSAMGVYGTYKGARELLGLKKIDRLPKVLCVQQESCAPMANAFQEGSETIQPKHVVRRPAGIAEAILRGDPTKAYPHIRKIVIESGGDLLAVSEAEIREARKMVEEMEGIYPCFSASTAVAGVIKQVRAGKFPLQDTVMINLTGADRKNAPAPKRVRWLSQQDGRWVESKVA